jgi:hypothetical protein
MSAQRWIVLISAAGLFTAAAAVRADGEGESPRLRELERLVREQGDRLARLEEAPEPAPRRAASLDVLVTGEGAVGYFDAQAEGEYPDGEFVLDEAKLFLDARVLPSVFFFAELNVRERETMDDEQVRFGEVYLVAEDLAPAWGEGLVNLKVGRFDIPVGEEYESRDAIDNALVSHSLADLWGFDEGVGLYGRKGTWDYALAVQNGGNPAARDPNSDKSVAVRVGCEPVPALRFSVSAYRTGDLDVSGDEMSEMWFGGGVFVPVGPPETTDTFDAELWQADGRYRWKTGEVSVFAGRIRAGDNDRAADHDVEGWYASVEARQELTRRLYAAARYSCIEVDPPGYPLVGQGDQGLLYRPDPPLVESLWRVSVGLGYRWHARLVTKAEYSWERGDTVAGADLDARDLVSLQQAFAF